MAGLGIYIRFSIYFIVSFVIAVTTGAFAGKIASLERFGKVEKLYDDDEHWVGVEYPDGLLLPTSAY